MRAGAGRRSSPPGESGFRGSRVPQSSAGRARRGPSVGSPTLASRRRQPPRKVASRGGTSPATHRKLGGEGRAARRFSGSALVGREPPARARRVIAPLSRTRGAKRWRLVDSRGSSDIFRNREKNKLFAVFGALFTLPARRGGAASEARMGESALSLGPRAWASRTGIPARGRAGGGDRFAQWCARSISAAHCGVESAQDPSAKCRRPAPSGISMSVRERHAACRSRPRPQPMRLGCA